jgi:predicted RNA-binding protein YlqC (UPF0109 family)
MSPKDFLHLIVSSLVINIDAIEIEEKHDELGILLSLKVDSSDM